MTQLIAALALTLLAKSHAAASAPEAPAEMKVYENCVKGSLIGEVFPEHRDFTVFPRIDKIIVSENFDLTVIEKRGTVSDSQFMKRPWIPQFTKTIEHTGKVEMRGYRAAGRYAMIGRAESAPETIIKNERKLQPTKLTRIYQVSFLIDSMTEKEIVLRQFGRFARKPSDTTAREVGASTENSLRADYGGERSNLDFIRCTVK